MIPVLLTQTHAASGDDPRARGDRTAATGEFANLLDSLSELTGEDVDRPRAPSSRERHGGSQTAQTSTTSSTHDEKTGDSRDAREAAQSPGQRPSGESPRDHGRDLLSRLAALVRKEPASHPSAQAPSAPAAEGGRETGTTGAPSHSPVPILQEPTATAGARGESKLWSMLASPTSPPDAGAEPALTPNRPKTEAEPVHTPDRPEAEAKPIHTPEPPKAEAEPVRTPDRPKAETANTDAPPLVDETDGAEAAASLLAMLPGALPAALADRTLTGTDDAERLPVPAAPVSEAAGEPADEPVAAPAMRIVLRETHFAPVLPGDPRGTQSPAPAFSLEPASQAEPPAHHEDRPRQADISRPRSTLQDGRTEPQPRMETQVQRTEEIEGASLTPRDTAADGPAPVATASNAAAAPSPGSIAAPPPLGSAPASGLASGSPAEQVSTAIRQAGTSPLANGMPVGASGGPVRILEIQLNPLELGVVTVRLRNGRDGLEIRVHAARAETAQMLAQDRTALLASLSDQGHVPADLTITSFGATAGLTGHDARTPTNAPWRAPDEDAGRRQPDSGTRRDDRQNPQNQNPRHRDTGERAAD